MRLPLIVRVGRSRRLDGVVACFYAAALGGICFSSLPKETMLLLVVGLAACRWREVGAARWAGVELRLGREGFLESRGIWPSPIPGDWVPTRILPASVVWPVGIVLRLAPESGGRGIALILLPDALYRDDYRRLRVWLRWRAEISRGGAAAF